MDNDELTIRVPSEVMKAEFFRILLRLGFATERAYRCAEIFTVNSLEGVYSHGVNRFPRFVKSVREGSVRPEAVPALLHRAGAIEQWDGNQGPGPLNAVFATDRATELASEHGIGMVALSNTNNWMRGGTYGWHAARKGYIFIGWTNTCPNMPAWGAQDHRLGNNPMVLAVPYGKDAIVMDFALSQFSYGRMEIYKREGKKLPCHGGYNKKGNLTSNPAEILDSWMPLPVGFWKGSGLALMLDILSTVLSGGLSTFQINPSLESGLSQVFMAIQIKNLRNFTGIGKSIDLIIEDLKKSVPKSEDITIRYPGENIIRSRQENSANGIPVNRDFWEKITKL